MEAGAKLFVGLRECAGSANTCREQQTRGSARRECAYQPMSMPFRNGAPFVKRRFKIYKLLLVRLAAKQEPVRLRNSKMTRVDRELCLRPPGDSLTGKPSRRPHLPGPAAYPPGVHSRTKPATRSCAKPGSRPSHCFHRLQFERHGVQTHGSPE